MNRNYDVLFHSEIEGLETKLIAHYVGVTTYAISTDIDLIFRHVCDTAVMTQSEAIEIAMQILKNENIIAHETTAKDLQNSAL